MAPGPATYDTSVLNQTHISYTIGKSQRSVSKDNILSPGPGTYYPQT